MKKLLTITALIFSINAIKTNDETIRIVPLFTVQQIGNISRVINSVTRKEIGLSTSPKKAYELARQLNILYTNNGKKLSQEVIDTITVGWITNNGHKKHTCTIL